MKANWLAYKNYSIAALHYNFIGANSKVTVVMWKLHFQPLSPSTYYDKFIRTGGTHTKNVYSKLISLTNSSS